MTNISHTANTPAEYIYQKNLQCVEIVESCVGILFMV